jgi:hypothetical protein
VGGCHGWIVLGSRCTYNNHHSHFNLTAQLYVSVYDEKVYLRVQLLLSLRSLSSSFASCSLLLRSSSACRLFCACWRFCSSAFWAAFSAFSNYFSCLAIASSQAREFTNLVRASSHPHCEGNENGQQNFHGIHFGIEIGRYREDILRWGGGRLGHRHCEGSQLIRTISNSKVFLTW